MSDYAIRIEGVGKTFGGVHALRDVDLRVRAGTIHALVGENGAGKSTLMNILAGILRRDKGTIEVFDDAVDFTSPVESQKRGIAIIHQELALAPDMSVAENMFLGDLGNGSPFVDWKTMNRKAGEALTAFGFNISPKTLCGDLSVAYQQIVEITKALVIQDCRVLILDEPTAVLADPETDVLFDNLRKLKESGITIIYISHRLEEIFRIADAITVFKDGRTVTDLDPRACTENDIITNMVGRKLEALFPAKPTEAASGDVLLKVDRLSRSGVLDDISLTLRAGEIVGLSGLIGSGRSEVVRAIFGIDPIDGGTIEVSGKRRVIRKPADAMRAGIGLVPEDRKRQGGILPMSIRENMTMTNLGAISRYGISDARAERRIAQASQERVKIKLGALSDALSSLSGGNQQKVIVAKWLNTNCKVLILDEPTRGVDVGAKVEIYAIIAALAASGVGILVISSELVEIIGLCHRTYVMSEGQIAGQLKGSEMTEEAIMRLAIPKRRIH
ncbi:sugar ABC transporter ATP-binding protein [Pleomorphomonas carboxyditropha]|uniref:Lantibiotic ABC transporter permease n=1 Tax=Pleomorphomonas carboxyditropha TaxID=2023338 RepID=A0A2G9WZL8_9HYPH|nr:sugar ABC transporter ATP-binding protein [Pleomorphomonas carboxyditropha]PIP00115.1 lantibiotic ABC transporter permease [Pleomorphomonas carboxyditropha]